MWGVLLALAGTVGLLPAVPGRAQTEIEKSAPVDRPPQQSEIKKGNQDDSPAPAAEPAATGWSAEISDRAVVTATAAEIGGDEARTRFTLVLSSATPYQHFTLADPYRLIIDMPDVSFQLPKGSGQQGRGLIQAYRYGLFAPGKSRIVIDTKGPVRIERAAMASRSGAAARLNFDLVPDRPRELPDQAAAAGTQDQGGARRRPGGPLRAEGPCQAGDRHRCGAWRGRSRRGQRRGAGEGRRAVRCPASAHHPGGEGPL